jgi:hypothetical protein
MWNILRLAQETGWDYNEILSMPEDTLSDFFEVLNKMLEARKNG